MSSTLASSVGSLATRDPIGESEPATVEDDNTREGREASKEPCQRSLLPVQIELRDPARNPDEVGPVAECLIGDLDLAARRVVGLRQCAHVQGHK